MNIICSSDRHIGISLGDYDRHEDVQSANDQIAAHIHRLNPEVYIDCGDVFHINRNLSESIKVFRLFCDQIQGDVKRAYFLVGNHDIVEQADKSHALDFGGLPDNMQVVDKITWIELGQYCGLLVPHLSRSRNEKPPEEILQGLVKEIDNSANPVLVFSHCNIGAIDQSKQLLFKFNHHVLPKEVIDHPKVIAVYNGHFHRPDDLGKLHIIGAPQRYTMDERDDQKRIFLISTVPGSEPESLPMVSRVMYELTLDFIDHKEEAQKKYDVIMAGDKTGIALAGAIIKVIIKIKEEDLGLVDVPTMEKKIAESAKYVYKTVVSIQREKRVRIKEMTAQDSPQVAVEKFLTEYERTGLLSRAQGYMG